MNTITKPSKLVPIVRSMIAASALASGLAHAALRDHGPSDPVVVYPQWYRDFNDLALGICRYADDAGNGPLCLTSPADTNPDGFAGNLGDEAFYATMDATLPVSAGSFQYLAHLEMAYGNASGAPPAIRDPANAAEIVFSRIRIRMDVPDGCGGHYILRHPFGINEFDAEPGLRSINYTDDVTAIPGDFSAVHKGHQGPFLTWDKDLPIVVQPPVGPAREYIGDPNVLHTYTGSAVLNTGDGLLRHPEHEYQNFVELAGPPDCDLGAGPGVPLFDDTAGISGVKWTQSIPTPTRIEKAVHSKSSSGKNLLDVWVTSSSGQNLVMTAVDDQSPSTPGIKLKENSTPSGTYYGHLEFDGDVPPQVTVTNLSSLPASQDKAAVVDAVEITKATYDSNTHVLCVTGHSKISSSSVTATLEAPPYGSLVHPAVPSSCTPVEAEDLVLEKDLDDFAPERISPPNAVTVHSSLGGSETRAVMSTEGVSDAVIAHMANNDMFSIQGSGQTSLNLAENDTNLPANYRIVIVSQPEALIDGHVVSSGTVTAPESGGTATYTAAEGLKTHDTFFHYAVLDTDTNQVSNVAKAELHVEFTAAPPVGVADSFAILRTLVNSTTARTYKASVLANDVTGLANIPIDPATIQIASQGTLGVATANPDGTITYKACVPSLVTPGTCASPLTAPNAGTDTFTYTVANTAGARSEPITVSVRVQNTAETLSVQRARFSGSRWDIRLSTNWFGAPLAPSVSCSLVVNNGATVNPSRLIGSAPFNASGAVQMQIAAGGTVPSATGTWQIRCTSSNGASVLTGPR